VAAQVLVKLSADLNRVRQRVTQLLHEYQGQDVGSAGSRLGERVPAGLPEDALARFDALDRRLTALERWVSMEPDLEDLDQEIAQVRREKEAAAARQDSKGTHAIDVRRDAMGKTAAHCSGSACPACCHELRSVITTGAGVMDEVPIQRRRVCGR
jgi:hypothetical protein